METEYYWEREGGERGKKGEREEGGMDGCWDYKYKSKGWNVLGLLSTPFCKIWVCTVDKWVRVFACMRAGVQVRVSARASECVSECHGWKKLSCKIPRFRFFLKILHMLSRYDDSALNSAPGLALKPLKHCFKIKKTTTKWIKNDMMTSPTSKRRWRDVLTKTSLDADDLVFWLTTSWFLCKHILWARTPGSSIINVQQLQRYLGRGMRLKYINDLN